MLNIAYVVSLFPCWSETFILNEIIELSKRGVNITILSLRRDVEGHVQKKAKPFIKKTRYAPPLGVLTAFMRCLKKRPRILIALLWRVLSARHNDCIPNGLINCDASDYYILHGNTLISKNNSCNEDKVKKLLYSCCNYKILSKNIWSVLVGCYFVEIVVKEKTGHIHAHFANYPTLAAMTISRLTGIPFTFTAHAHDVFLDKTLLQEKIEAAKAVVSISNYNRQYLLDSYQGISPVKIKVIRCGLGLTEWEFLTDLRESKEAIIVSIGRLTKMKGFEFLIRACAWLKDRRLFKCQIIGGGELDIELQGLINHLELSDRVSLEGVLDNSKVRERLKTATAFVLPSIWDDQEGQEGIPLVLIEAMALGIPCLASKISGIPELIIDGKTGMLVSPKDVKGLSDRMLELLDNNGLRKRLSLNGRAKIENEFDIAKSVDRLLEVFYFVPITNLKL
ncbi:MAG: glycosyltransferase family 4 protein [bacterium]